VTPSNRKKLRRNFFKPILFETIFCAALALHCGIHRGSGSAD
jgi:hypothetical protein